MHFVNILFDMEYLWVCHLCKAYVIYKENMPTCPQQDRIYGLQRQPGQYQVHVLFRYQENPETGIPYGHYNFLMPVNTKIVEPSTSTGAGSSSAPAMVPLKESNIITLQKVPPTETEKQTLGAIEAFLEKCKDHQTRAPKPPPKGPFPPVPPPDRDTTQQNVDAFFEKCHDHQSKVKPPVPLPKGEPVKSENTQHNCDRFFGNNHDACVDEAPPLPPPDFSPSPKSVDERDVQCEGSEALGANVQSEAVVPSHSVEETVQDSNVDQNDGKTTSPEGQLVGSESMSHECVSRVSAVEPGDQVEQPPVISQPDLQPEPEVLDAGHSQGTAGDHEITVASAAVQSEAVVPSHPVEETVQDSNVDQNDGKPTSPEGQLVGSESMSHECVSRVSAVEHGDQVEQPPVISQPDLRPEPEVLDAGHSQGTAGDHEITVASAAVQSEPEAPVESVPEQEDFEFNRIAALVSRINQFKASSGSNIDSESETDDGVDLDCHDSLEKEQTDQDSSAEDVSKTKETSIHESDTKNETKTPTEDSDQVQVQLETSDAQSDNCIFVIRLGDSDCDIVLSDLGVERQVVLLWGNKKMVNCETHILKGRTGSAVVGIARVLAQHRILNFVDLRKLDCFKKASTELRTLWKNRMQNDGGRLFVWHIVGVTQFDSPMHLSGCRVPKYSKVELKRLKSCNQSTLPNLDLQETAMYFLNCLGTGDVGKLEQTMKHLDKCVVKVGTACSGTDIAVSVLKATLSAFAQHFQATRLKTYMHENIHIYRFYRFLYFVT